MGKKKNSNQEPKAVEAPAHLRTAPKPRPELELPLASLSSSTGTSSALLAALKAAFGWSEQTRLTRREFVKRRAEWLQKPAKEN